VTGRLLRAPFRAPFRVRCCGPAGYALNVAGEVAGLAAVLAVLVPLHDRIPGLMSWPWPARAAAAGFYVLLAAWDVALLRLRRRTP
jgi:hypothetical protein